MIIKTILIPAVLFLVTVAQAADITDITCRQRKANRQHCDLILDGEPWSHGSVPGNLTGQEILDFLEGQKSQMRLDLESSKNSTKE